MSSLANQAAAAEVDAAQALQHRDLRRRKGASKACPGHGQLHEVAVPVPVGHQHICTSWTADCYTQLGSSTYTDIPVRQPQFCPPMTFVAGLCQGGCQRLALHRPGGHADAFSGPQGRLAHRVHTLPCRLQKLKVVSGSMLRSGFAASRLEQAPASALQHPAIICVPTTILVMHHIRVHGVQLIGAPSCQCASGHNKLS